MDTRGDLLSCLMFGGRWRWSGRSLDIRGDSLSIMPLSSSIARKSFIISAADAVVVAFVDLFNTFVLFGAMVVDFVILLLCLNFAYLK